MPEGAGEPLYDDVSLLEVFHPSRDAVRQDRTVNLHPLISVNYQPILQIPENRGCPR